MRAPPASGPTMLASANVAANRPIQRPRSFGENRSPTEAKAVVMIIPAPTPWTARKAISQSMSPAAPHNHEPATKVTMPARMNGFRPYRSESFPTTGTSAVEANRYEVTGQTKRSRPSRSCAIAGIETVTIVWSSAARNIVESTPASTSALRRAESDIPGGRPPSFICAPPPIPIMSAPPRLSLSSLQVS